MKTGRDIMREIKQESECNDKVDIESFDFPFGNDSMYEVTEYDREREISFYIRKYGERDGFWISTSECQDPDELLIELMIENYELKKKIRNARKAMR